MKILLSAYACEPYRGSEPGNGWAWAETLAAHGHHVVAITTSHGRGAIEQRLDELSRPPNLIFRYLDVRGVSGQAARPKLRAYSHYLRWQAALGRLTGRQPEGFDVMHHVSLGSLHMGTGLRKNHCPLVYGPIGGGQVAPPVSRAYFGSNWWSESLRTHITSSGVITPVAARTIREADVVLATNRATLEAARNHGARRVELMLAEGIHADLVRPHPAASPPAGVPLVVWVGRFLPRKAPGLALDAFTELIHSMPTRLMMIGDGPLWEDISREVVRRGLSHLVELTGRIAWAQVHEALRNASAYLFTSLRDSSGAQFLEAMGAGVPAVVLDHHGVGEFAPAEACIKVPVGSPREMTHSMAAALARLLEEQYQWTSRSEAALRFARGHTWDAKVRRAEALYESLLR